MIHAIAYLLSIAAAEVVTNIIDPLIGLGLYTVMLLIIIIDSAILNRYFQSKLVLSLALVPLIRIVSLSLPLTHIPQIWWYPVIYLPLLAAAIALAVILEYKPGEIGINIHFWPAQIAVGLFGLGLGSLEYLILSPEPMVNQLTWQAAWLPILLVFISTGVVEEFIFRGILQKSAVDRFGLRGMLYISVIFTILHIGWIIGPDAGPLAWLDIVFVLAVALFFSWVVRKTGSLLGVILCHGLINVVLFIVAPLIF